MVWDLGSVLFGFYSYVITLIVGLLSGISGLHAGLLLTGLLQMLGISLSIYIAILPIIAFTSRKPGLFMGGVIVSFLFGYCAMFIKDVTLRSLYPILSGMTAIGFDTEAFMNTSEPGNLALSLLSLAVMLLLTTIIVMLTNSPQTPSKRKQRKQHKASNIFLRPGQKGKAR